MVVKETTGHDLTQRYLDVNDEPLRAAVELA